MVELVHLLEYFLTFWKITLPHISEQLQAHLCHKIQSFFKNIIWTSLGVMIFGIIIIRSKIPNSVSYIQLLTPALAEEKK